MIKEEQILKERKEVIGLLKELIKVQKKATNHLVKMKEIDFKNLLDLSDVIKKYDQKIDSVDHWVRNNNELIKKLIVEAANKLRLTNEEREALEGER